MLIQFDHTRWTILENNLILLLSIFLFYPAWTVDSLPNFNQRKVCIIGAGVSGLGSARIFSEYHREFEVVVFEKNADIGGQWLYSNYTDLDENNLPVHSGVWKNMRTNTFARIMSYPDYPMPKEYFMQVHHEKVLEYLKNYTRHFDLHRYIRFNTLVTKVSPMINGWTSRERWQVKTKNLETDTISTAVCDMVMVCSGHLSRPNIPVIPGMRNFPGKVSHSHSYRLPDEYVNKTVLILGFGASGSRIALELRNYAKKVYLSHNRVRLSNYPIPKVTQVAGLSMAAGRKLKLKDGSWLKDVEAIIYCTGYVNDLPFLDKSSGVTVTGKAIKNLYYKVFNSNYPTMSFIGWEDNVSIFKLSYKQANYVLREALRN